MQLYAALSDSCFSIFQTAAPPPEYTAFPPPASVRGRLHGNNKLGNPGFFYNGIMNTGNLFSYRLKHAA